MTPSSLAWVGIVSTSSPTPATAPPISSSSNSETKKFLSSQPDKKPDDEKPLSWHILENHSLLALQGPASQSLLQPLLHDDPEDSNYDTDLSTLYFSHSRWLQLDIPESCSGEGTALSTPSLLISRTGYTGEDGFEISIPPENGSSVTLATSIAKALLQAKSRRFR